MEIVKVFTKGDGTCKRNMMLVCTQAGWSIGSGPLSLSPLQWGVDWDTDRNGVFGAVSFVIVYLSFTDSNRISAAKSHRRVNRSARRRAHLLCASPMYVCARVWMFMGVFIVHTRLCVCLCTFNFIHGSYLSCHLNFVAPTAIKQHYVTLSHFHPSKRNVHTPGYAENFWLSNRKCRIM